MTKCDSALLQLIGEMKLIKHFELIHSFELRLFRAGKDARPASFLGNSTSGVAPVCPLSQLAAPKRNHKSMVAKRLHRRSGKVNSARKFIAEE